MKLIIETRDKVGWAVMVGYDETVLRISCAGVCLAESSRTERFSCAQLGTVVSKDALTKPLSQW